MNPENATGIANVGELQKMEALQIPNPEPQASGLAAVAPPPVRIIGVGNAGSNLVDTLIRQGTPAASCAVINSDAITLGASLAAEKISLEDKQGRGIGCGGDPERGRTGAESREPEISALCKDAKVVILLAGMGGGAGTGGAPVVARVAKAAGAMVVGVVAMPFECEGALRTRIAESGVLDLRKEADLVLPFKNDRAVPTDTQTSVLDTFKTANELLACSVRCLSNAFTAGSVMGLPVQDICGLMRDRSEECLMATAEAAGEDRATAVAEKLMSHPALERGAATLAEADTVAVCVVGGTTLAIGEINKIVDRTAQESASSPLVMGAAIAPELSDKVSVILLVGYQKEASRPENRRQTPQDPVRAPWPTDLTDNKVASARPRSRIVPPPPEISQERARQIHGQTTGKGRKLNTRMRQGQLPLDIISRGRFDKSEPTILKGEDLDIPTYVRRGISLN